MVATPWAPPPSPPPPLPAPAAASHMAVTQAFADALRSCGARGALSGARALHGRLVSVGLASAVFLQNTLLHAYLSCGALPDARSLLRGEITEPNVITHNIMMNGYAKLGSLSDAVELFGRMPRRDVTSWNTLMSGYFQGEQFLDALETFMSMRRIADSLPNAFTFGCTMKSCGALGWHEVAPQLLGLLTKFGFEDDPDVATAIVDMFVRCGAVDFASKQFSQIERPTVFCRNSMLAGYAKSYGVDHALELFESMPERDVVSWNMMVSALSQSGRAREALCMAVDMHNRGVRLDSTTYTSSLTACAKLSSLGWGKQLHAQVIRSLPHIDPYVASAMVELYAKCGCFEEAKRVFSSLRDRNTVAWTVLIGGFLQYGCFSESLELFNQMRAELMTVDQFALATIISGCSNRMDMCLARQLHSLSLKSGHTRAVVISNSLISMYAKCGNLQNAESIFTSMAERDIVSWTGMLTAYSQVGNIGKAREFFDGMSTRNVITWNAMLGAYIQHGAEEDGLKMYSAMLTEKDVIPDWVTYVTLFRGCADMGANKLGDQIIGHTVKVGLILDTSVVNAVITMYSKCGRITEARKIFEFLSRKDLVSWNAMITGYSQHGMGKQAIEIFDDMLKKGAKPDYISYVAVLSSCSHSGLVQEGKFYFDMLKRDHNVSPGLEHFSCMVDLLARAGNLIEAKNLIDEMPMKPTAEVWGALLSACKTHGNNDLAELAAKHLFDLDSPDSGGYMLLAKIYADAGKSDDSAQVRKLMRDKGIKKNPGYSWMEVKNKVHVFKAEDVSHPQVIAIREKLDELMEKIAHLGYVRTESLRSEIHHSEKLAVAFGIMNLPDWMPIHIMKNLRICGDCHTVIKLISMVTGREFVIRDAVRFHHFKGGSCSCGDYW
ncbi:pentatricopeptide repeat-containing protein At3g26782, mitochondrial-like [Triticum dicoccoides]|uniref:pentatricopeptide repeat-containing protein At3g26782, mitochondrial-like n=1 Tax=Triticum dicoccoides TaxID=85692 RepID=UPI00188F2A60|nr:pentatricopeptide repeat-containing protein At3g26782, mitochondrial-like [Triticum dicoccoides]